MSKREQQFNKNLINEIFSLALRNKGMMATAIDHLKEDYMPDDDYRAIYRAMRKHWLAYRRPITMGILTQKFYDEDDVFEILNEIKETEVESSPDELIDEMEDYIKKSMFVTQYELIGEDYNKGHKKKAIDRLQKLCENLNNFSLKASTYDTVMEDFVERALEARANRVYEDGLPEDRAWFGIDALDELSGGLSKTKGNLVCFMAPSGGGKSKILRYVGANNAKRGLNVLHVQLEGTREETLVSYDATITGVSVPTLEAGLIDPEKLGNYDEYISKKVDGEIFVKAYEKFSESASTGDVRQMIFDLEKSHNIKIDVLVVDYLELLETSDRRDWSPKDERHRRTKIADELMDISKELKLVVFTATQANTVEPDKLNDPRFVLSRYNVSEAKGIIKPATWFITINRTNEEIQEQFARLFIDKSRYTRSGDVIPICTSYGRDQFYDRKRTMEMAA